jgi:hypothetical protein
MMYLVFEDYKSAYIANAIISLNMRLSGYATVQWAEIQERADSKFVILKPDAIFMDFIDGYTEEEYQESWFGEPPIYRG